MDIVPGQVRESGSFNRASNKKSKNSDDDK